MEIYGIGGITLKWFGNYLTNRKQYIQISNIKNTFKGCCMRSSPGINIRSSLIFDTVYVNDVQYAPNLLDPIMFADDTNMTKTKYSFFHDSAKKIIFP